MEPAEQESFDAFVRGRYVELLRFGRALTGSQDEGADLLHDALVSTMRAWRRIEGADPEGYVRRSMVNRNISVWRRRSRVAGFASPPPPADRDWALAVWSAIRSLPSRQRTVIALRFYEELSVAETAALMGSSEGTVKSQTSKAVAHLRLALGPEEASRVAE